jgi:hypothetical protein
MFSLYGIVIEKNINNLLFNSIIPRSMLMSTKISIGNNKYLNNKYWKVTKKTFFIGK